MANKWHRWLPSSFGSRNGDPIWGICILDSPWTGRDGLVRTHLTSADQLYSAPQATAYHPDQSTQCWNSGTRFTLPPSGHTGERSRFPLQFQQYWDGTWTREEKTVKKKRAVMVTRFFGWQKDRGVTGGSSAHRLQACAQWNSCVCRGGGAWKSWQNQQLPRGRGSLKPCILNSLDTGARFCDGHRLCQFLCILWAQGSRHEPSSIMSRFVYAHTCARE